MDPDATLRICLDNSLPADERRAAALDLTAWLRRGGFPPSARTVEESGVTKRRPLAPPRPRCHLYLEKHGRRWAIVFTGVPSAPTVIVWHLREEGFPKRTKKEA